MGYVVNETTVRLNDEITILYGLVSKADREQRKIQDQIRKDQARNTLLLIELGKLAERLDRKEEELAKAVSGG